MTVDLQERFAKIARRKVELRKLDKKALVRAFPSRLDKTHLLREDKWTLICGILEAEFGRKALEEFDRR